MIADLTFDYARDYFSRKKVEFGESHFHQLGFTDESGGFTNLALLFSGQNPHLLKIAEFASSESLTFADRKEIGGSILRQLEMAYDWGAIGSSRPTAENESRRSRRERPTIWGSNRGGALGITSGV